MDCERYGQILAAPAGMRGGSVILPAQPRRAEAPSGLFGLQRDVGADDTPAVQRPDPCLALPADACLADPVELGVHSREIMPEGSDDGVGQRPSRGSSGPRDPERGDRLIAVKPLADPV